MIQLLWVFKIMNSHLKIIRTYKIIQKINKKQPHLFKFQTLIMKLKTN